MLNNINSDSPNLVMASRLGREIMRVQIPHPRPIHHLYLWKTSYVSNVEFVQFEQW